MAAIQVVEMAVIQAMEGTERVQEAEEMAKSVAAAMQDLNRQCYVGSDNMTTLTLSPICMVSDSPL
jgi:hypothetical protein